jgi:putative hydrolase of the HAD superfamily
MINAILFDLDETLLDRTGSLRMFLADQYKRHEAISHISVEDYTELFLTLDARGTKPQLETYTALLGHLGQVDDDLANTMHGEYEDGFPQFVQLVEGAEELLLYLRQKGLRTGIISNGREDHQMRNIYKLKLDLLVDGILVSEKEGIRKPDPEVFWRAASRLSLKPEQCLFVGDNPEADILGAQTAGMQSMWVPNGATWPAGAPTNPGFEADSLKAVHDMLVRIGV